MSLIAAIPATLAVAFFLLLQLLLLLFFSARCENTQCEPGAKGLVELARFSIFVPDPTFIRHEDENSDIELENLMGIDQRGVDGVWVLVEAG